MENLVYSGGSFVRNLSYVGIKALERAWELSTLPYYVPFVIAEHGSKIIPGRFGEELQKTFTFGRKFIESEAEDLYDAAMLTPVVLKHVFTHLGNMVVDPKYLAENAYWNPWGTLVDFFVARSIISGTVRISRQGFDTYRYLYKQLRV